MRSHLSYEKLVVAVDYQRPPEDCYIRLSKTSVDTLRSANLMTRATLPGFQFPNGNLWKILPLAMLLCATFVLPALAQEKEKLWRTL
ncbi:MAG: hypothetical protein ACYTXY_29930, partial [Nostoc sp.]